MPILSKAVCTSNTIPINSRALIHRYRNDIKMYVEIQMNKDRQSYSGGIIMSDFKLDYGAIVIKTASY